MLSNLPIPAAKLRHLLNHCVMIFFATQVNYLYHLWEGQAYKMWTSMSSNKTKGTIQPSSPLRAKFQSNDPRNAFKFKRMLLERVFLFSHMAPKCPNPWASVRASSDVSLDIHIWILLLRRTTISRGFGRFGDRDYHSTTDQCSLGKLLIMIFKVIGQ